MEKISLAIPTYNRFELLLQSFEKVMQDPRITDIVIVDDASTGDVWDQLRKWAGGRQKISLYRNPQNLDCYANKAEALVHTLTSWAILLDSDNVIDHDYLDAIYNLAPWDNRTVYCPVFAAPAFDYRKFEGLRVTRRNVADYAPDITFLTALNTANYFVPVQGYLHCWDKSVDPHTADSLYMAYRFLEEGYTLHFVEGLHYFHRIHDGSHYRLNHHKTGGFAEEVERKLRAMK